MSAFIHTHTEEIYLALSGIGCICIANLMLSFFPKIRFEIRAGVITCFAVLGFFCAEHAYRMKNLSLLFITVIPFALCSIHLLK